MDVLVALGTISAYVYSLHIVIKALTSKEFEGQDFFKTSAMLISFILLGKYLEVVAMGRTSDALAKLTDLAPETACLLILETDGNVVSRMEINTQLIQRNDIIKIFPGTKVFVDGVVAMGPNFKKLSVDHIVSAYVNTNSRLILLDYDGTMMSESSVDKTPSNEAITMSNALCSDPKNVVFVSSGRGKDSLNKWFSTYEKLGISGEHGSLNRGTKDFPWEFCPLMMESSWKKMAKLVMELYTETTDGSSIEPKEAVLEGDLTNEPAVVKTGQHQVGGKPQGVSKGLVVENLISTMRSKGKTLEKHLFVKPNSLIQSYCWFVRMRGEREERWGCLEKHCEEILQQEKEDVTWE
ncbi:probable alpha,alpha-trehalose-phosphate synthase [UDP-forming] 11 [Malania oleifera]|uniref:probable alpha,alpha-trehalose-phosphate synthase [UDP-forming] 11 n=1 Tax=Malania oleifera TaxID=397392 RepID=UPI0025AE66EC|nr:probable alpha,alpha-trehalose-phosphate synthase [UDP-forming] 11 [Malania oleifera]